MDAFLLSREWRDRDAGIEVVLWARAAEGPVRARLTGVEAVMFVPRDVDARADRRAARPLTTLQGTPVDALYFRSQRRLLEERDRIRSAGGAVYESDVKPQERFLMERFVHGALRFGGEGRRRNGVIHLENPTIQAADVRVPLSVLSLDLETDGFDGPLLSAAIATRDHEEVIVTRSARERGPDRGVIRFVPDEQALLVELFAAIRALDPDALLGWNVIEFDLQVLEARARMHRLDFAIGRAGETARVLPGGSPRQVAIARVPGRVVLDGIAVLKSATYRFDRFTLDHVARELLGRGKKIAAGVDPVAEIRRMHAEDADALAAYNLEDCRLVLDVFAKAGLVDFAMERARMTGLPMDRQGGSVAAFDHLYLPRLHRRGVVAQDVGDEIDLVPSPGGHVLDSVPGLYRDVLAFDFRSLYPSIIRTFRIDPLGLARPGEDPLPGEDGATFARAPEASILPGMIETLHDARSRAMAEGNEPLSRTIKILMNSFYGVLGTPGCRFFDARLPTSITRRGHAVIERARAFFVERGYAVLYGDTDSLFVHMEGEPPEDLVRERGKALAAELTETLGDEVRRDLGVESFLELKFEAHYLRFLMPTTRGTAKGSKKRYAGWVRKSGEPALVVRGLEAVRTDWTPLARRVQRELLRRVFAGEPFEAWLEEVARDLVAGKLDAELVYTKSLRQSLDAYAGEGAPPHVRAARMREAEDPNEAQVEYVVTTRGPEPAGERKSPIDHDHYLTKQLAPACDVVLPMLGTTFERVAGTQRSLF
ncbi:MAG TPA: DNA polymerase II [Polyangiaceae bacterium]|nr:DNA polymerase II [Polyangiaceae bacterium]